MGYGLLKKLFPVNGFCIRKPAPNFFKTYLNRKVPWNVDK